MQEEIIYNSSVEIEEKLYQHIEINNIKKETFLKLFNKFDQINYISLNNKDYIFETDINCFLSNDNYYSLEEIKELILESIRFNCNIYLVGYIQL